MSSIVSYPPLIKVGITIIGLAVAAKENNVDEDIQVTIASTSLYVS